MSLSRTNIVLAGLLLLVLLLGAAVQVDHSRPNSEFLPEMKRSPARAAYSVNNFLAGGRTLQPPVAGTIARGDLPLHYAATKEDAVRAGEELQNPFREAVEPPPADAIDAMPTTPPDTITPATLQPPAGALMPEAREARLQASLQRGAQIYRISCLPCHGPGGAGDGPVARRGFPPPPPLTTGKSTEMQDGQIFHILTYGQGSMASMAAQLSREGRWDVINHVRRLQQDAAAATPPPAEAATATPTETPLTPSEPQAEEGQP